MSGKLSKGTIAIFLLLLTGCWDINEPERMDYIYSIGVDYVDHEIVVHLQLVNLSSLGTPEITSQAESRSVIATESAHTVSEAVHKIYQSAQQRVYLGHNTSIILTESALQAGKLVEAIDLANRFPDTRYRMNIFATKDYIPDLFKASTIFQGSPILTRITDLENIYEQSSRIENLSLRELIIFLDEPGYQSHLPVISVDKDVWQTEDNPLTMIKDVGIALITSSDVKGFLLEDDVNGLRWTVASERNNVTIYDSGQPVGELIVVRPKQKYTLQPSESDVTFKIEIKARAMLNEILQDVTEEKIIAIAEEQIKKEVMNTYHKALEKGSDVYRLSEKVYRHHLKTWQEINEEGLVPLTKDSLNVEVTIDLVDSGIDKTKPTVK